MRSFNEWLEYRLLNEKESTLVPGQESFYPRYIVRIITENSFNHYTGLIDQEWKWKAESIWRTLEEAKDHVEKKMGQILNVPFRPAYDGSKDQKSVGIGNDHRDKYHVSYDKNKWLKAIIKYKEARRQPEKTVFKVERKIDLTGYEPGIRIYNRSPEFAEKEAKDQKRLAAGWDGW